jgi:hypothetical protein
MCVSWQRSARPALRIEGSGGTSLSIDDLRTTTLMVSGAGALKAVLAGQVADQSISISGAGEYQAAQLISDNAIVDVSGAGHIVVNARKTPKGTFPGPEWWNTWATRWSRRA